MHQSKSDFRKLLPVFYSFFTVLCLMIVLCGCTYQSAHRIDSNPQIQVEEVYLGNWEGSITDETYGKRTDFKMMLSRKNDVEYNLNFIGLFGRVNKKNVPQIDTVKSTAFISEVNNRLFMNVTMDARVYIAEFIYHNDEISILPMAEEFTSFILTKDEQLRTILEYHLKTRLKSSYDRSFCMRNMKREPSIP